MSNDNLAWLGFIPLLFLFVVAVVAGIPFWRICSRTGLSKGLVAILLVPVIGWLLLSYIDAFSGWPAMNSLSQRRDHVLE
jgi:hypothetical protein